AKMGRRQCKSAYNIIKNKTTPESSPPPTPKSDYCNADKAEENDLKKSLMKMLEEAFEEKMKNVSKEIGEKSNPWTNNNSTVVAIRGTILEKMDICSMPRFFRFVQDSTVLKNNVGVFVKDLRFGTVPVRLFQPKAASSKPRKGIIFFHGGGTVVGSIEPQNLLVFSFPIVKLNYAKDCYHNLCTFLARETDSVLLSVGYRKVPYYHHPFPLLDCLNASIHFLKSSKAYGVDPSQIAVCGDSIGGGAAVIITQTLVGRADLPKIRAQILIYPVLQAFYFQSPSKLQYTNIPLLTKDFMMNCLCRYAAIDPSWKDAMLTGACVPPSAWKKYEKWLSPDNIPKMFRRNYQQPESPAPFNEAAYLETKHTMNKDISPLIADDEIIAQVPEAFLVTLQWDIIRDDGLLYKKRLEDQGVPVTWYHVDGFHGCAVLFDSVWPLQCLIIMDIDSSISDHVTVLEF
ncbi:hypothetical protein STEG23_013446, partial [Scotinomys teguina]